MGASLMGCCESMVRNLNDFQKRHIVEIKYLTLAEQVQTEIDALSKRFDMRRMSGSDIYRNVVNVLEGNESRDGQITRYKVKNYLIEVGVLDEEDVDTYEPESPGDLKDPAAMFRADEIEEVRGVFAEDNNLGGNVFDDKQLLRDFGAL